MAGGIMQRWKGAVVGTSRSLFQLGNSLGNHVKTSGQVNSQVSAAGVGNGADTTEDTLFTATLDQNALNVNGRAVSIKVFGSLANNAHTKTLRVYFGSSVVWTPINGTGAAVGFAATLFVWRSGTKVQIASGEGAVNATALPTPSPIAGVEDDTLGIVIKVTGQTATAAANDIVCNGMIISGFN